MRKKHIIPKEIDLCNIAKKYGTDKVGHGYTKYYHDILKSLTNKEINMLEIGIFWGASIKMWNEYFKHGNIFCIDNCIPTNTGDHLCNINIVNDINKYSSRIHGYNCCQKSREKLQGIFLEIKFDIIVDDGSHLQEDQQISLGCLFKNLKSKGIYIIEDICTMWAFKTGSWWGQKHGIENTSAHKIGGKNLWLEEYKKTGKLRTEDLFSDTTWYVLHYYIKNKKFISPYLTEEENNYLTENIESIEIVAAPESRDDYIHSLGIPKYEGTPGSTLKAGCIAIINKK
jgi:hypothetical protein